MNNNKVAVSFITEIELLGWKNLDDFHIKVVNDFLSSCLYLDYSFQIKQYTIEIKRKYNLKTADAFLAATSMQFDVPLVSADKIFSRVDDLKFVQISPFNE